MFAVLILLLLVPSVGPLNDLMEVYATPSKGRGRLVVACDMRSDTCSDGRRITTVRATPVPCETSPGVWEMVPEDTGCYSVRGLESWAATTSYLAYGAELDNPVWRGYLGGTVEVLPDGYRIHPAPGVSNSGVRQSDIVPVSPGGETRTFACIVRTYRPAYIRFWFSGNISSSFPVVDTGGRWEVIYGTRTLPDTAGPTAVIGNGPATEDPVPFDVKACWLTRTDTPGRPCWGGEAPVTCDADRHTISTEGWPTMHGSIEIEFRIDEAPQRFAIILDGRSGDTTGFNIHYDRNTGRLHHRQGDRVMAGPTITLGTWYRVRLEREGGDARMLSNGVLVAAESDWPAWSYPHPSGVAILGKHYSVPSSYLNGSIRSLRIRSYEEVSP